MAGCRQGFDAAAELSRGDDAFVFVGGDGGLCAAAERIGLEVIRTGGGAENS
jgi:hypothetical protein